MRYYTKSGDRGTTAIVGGLRVPKDDARVALCGEIDELNAHIGVLCSLVGGACGDELTAIQTRLFHIGTGISSGTGTGAGASDVASIEAAIDRLQAATPDIDTFVLPGGCRAAAEAHVCRTVCRRVERGAVAVARRQTVAATTMQYVNRLSDYFFALALNLNFIKGIAEKKLYIPCK